MKIFTTSQIKEIDAFTIVHEPIHSVDLMERAAKACVNWISENVKPVCPVKLFAGSGNNGGDAWAVARLLADINYKNISLFFVKISDKISQDSAIHKKRLKDQGKVSITDISDENNFPPLYKEDIIIDGIFGSGLTRPVEGLAAKLIRYVNQSGATVISIDIPSGLFGEDNSENNSENIIRACYTLTFQFPKLSFFFTENEDFVGEWHILPIGLHSEVIKNTTTPFYFLTPGEISGKIKKRKKFSHKGTYGNALLIAGSYGMMGAAVIAAKACLRAGTGLVTAHVPQKGVNVMQSAFPESLISIDQSEKSFTSLPELSRYSAIGAGPGIGMGKETQSALKNLLEKCENPVVLDADALNIIGLHKDWLNLIPRKSILTPHPKEFERIAGASKNSYERLQKQANLSQQFNIIIVVKGAYSTVTFPDGSCCINSTGNPGMATAGSGDVLTGIILSFLAQKFTPEDAVVAGVFMHGLAADLAVKDTGEYSLISSDIIDYLGKAFIYLEKTS